MRLECQVSKLCQLTLSVKSISQHLSPNFFRFRDAPEPTGEEPEDADLEAPKIYEMVTKLVQCDFFSVL